MPHEPLCITMQSGVQGAQLTPEQLGDVYYYLALAYTRAGRPEDARSLLEPLVGRGQADPRMVKLLRGINS
ncbi:MAG TPA: tetratricopeptide repeat protein [Rhodothermales bacterium]|nr:tetratricopeptide repeat protein [Rhodothermales bacterium]